LYESRTRELKSVGSFPGLEVGENVEAREGRLSRRDDPSFATPLGEDRNKVLSSGPEKRSSHNNLGKDRDHLHIQPSEEDYPLWGKSGGLSPLDRTAWAIACTFCYVMHEPGRQKMEYWGRWIYLQMVRRKEIRPRQCQGRDIRIGSGK